MGWTQAQGMADAVAEGAVSLEVAIEYHLTANHYPPVPRVMIDVCIDALAKADPDAEIDLPDGVTHRDGRRSVRAWEIFESFHLYPFLQDVDDV